MYFADAVAMRADGASVAACHAFLVEKGNPGLSMGRKERKLGVRASHTAQVILQDCFVPAENRLGRIPPLVGRVEVELRPWSGRRDPDGCRWC